MFSILDFKTTTPEQVEQAVKDGLIHSIAAEEWLSSRDAKIDKDGRDNTLKMV